jgi:hypothetical protein
VKAAVEPDGQKCSSVSGGEDAMPVHDWTRVAAAIFHHFHSSWIGEIKRVLNDRPLPSGPSGVSASILDDRLARRQL